MNSNKGFTLIETLIAMALITIAIFVFAPIYAQSLKQISDAGIWQNVIIEQRASIEKQLAGRSAILSNDTEFPPIDITLNLYEEGVVTSDIAAEISGKNIKDTLTNKTNIRSFLTNIYQNEIMNDTVPVGDDDEVDDPDNPEIIVAPKTIYYGEDLYKDNTNFKTFTVYGVNLTFTAELVNNIKISGHVSPDIKSKFNIIYNETANSIDLLVNSLAPDNFFLEAPFIITYNTNYTAVVNILLPQIIAVSNKGDFISGFYKNGNIEFSKIIGKIPSISSSHNINQIVYNFQRREYVVVGDSNLCRVFEIIDKNLAWEIKDTTVQFPAPAINNNYSISVDWLDNYMIGSSYNTTANKGKIEVFLSVYELDENLTYALKTLNRKDMEKGSGKGSIQSIDAKWFDFIRSTIFVESFNADNVFLSAESYAENYILALGYYGVKTQTTGNDTITDYYDFLYATESYTTQTDAAWIDISSTTSGMPSNQADSSVKITGVANGVGRYEQSSGGTVTKSADFSILLACTDMGKIYGVSPSRATNFMIVQNNTDWKLVMESDSAKLEHLNSIVYGNDVFVAVGSGVNNVLIGTVKKNTEDNKKFDISISWEYKKVGSADFKEIEFINEKFYAVGSQGSKGVIYSSSSGSDWISTPLFTTTEDCTITSIAGE